MTGDNDSTSLRNLARLRKVILPALVVGGIIVPGVILFATRGVDTPDRASYLMMALGCAAATAFSTATLVTLSLVSFAVRQRTSATSMLAMSLVVLIVGSMAIGNLAQLVL
jgi:hypothetical protein